MNSTKKIQWYKVYFRPKILNKLVDKYEVKEYVRKKIGPQYLNETIGVYSKASQINFDDLPNRFVVKGVHASSYNLSVKDKLKLDRKKAKRKFRKWLRTNWYYRIGQEWAYKDVKPKLLVEKYIEQENSDSLSDYKFYCFNGKVAFMEIHLDRFSSYKCSLFDLDFKELPFTDVSMVDMKILKNLEKPSNFEEMVFLAEKLAGKLPFVRVDFYSVKGKTIFREMTFYPTDGRKDLVPEEYNKIVGDYFELPKISKGKKYITEFEV